MSTIAKRPAAKKTVSRSAKKPAVARATAAGSANLVGNRKLTAALKRSMVKAMIG